MSAAGVFSISYPTSLDQIETQAPQGYYYGTILSTGDTSAASGVFFRPLDGPFTDADWVLSAQANAGIDVLSADFELGLNMVELDRWTRGNGEHLVNFEFESEESRGLSRIEEAGGVLAVALWATTVDRWPEMREAMVESVASFGWSPEAAASRLPP